MNDGIIEFGGTVTKKCGHCGADTTCIRITSIQLPDDIKPSTKLIPFQPYNHDPGWRPLTYLGIGCGCYAKAHRQIAHIQDRQKR